MEVSDPRSLGAACLFLVLFTASTAGSGFATFRKGLLSPYIFLFIISVFRVMAELCMIVFVTLGYKHHTWLLAHMCLSAQSLYLLLISTFGRLANAEYLSFGESVLNPNERKSAIAKVPKIGERWCSPKTIFTCIIIPANAFALAGGLMTTSESAGAPMDPSKAPTSVGLQATGQFVLLALATALSLRSLSVTNRNRIRNCTASTVSFACMFLVSRAIYGFISCFIRELNYFIPYNYYTHTGAYTTFTTTYYIFGPTMEFCSVILLLSSYFVPNQHEYGLTNNQIVD